MQVTSNVIKESKKRLRREPRATPQEAEAFLNEYNNNGRNATRAMMKVRPHLEEHYFAAAQLGRSWLQRVDAGVGDLLLHAEKGGLTPKKVVDKIQQLLDSKKITKIMTVNGDVHVTEEDNIIAINSGLTHALKIGIGGGYAPETLLQKGTVGHVHMNLGDIFEAARQKEEAIRSGMDPEAYKARVKNIIAEVIDNKKNE